MNYCNADIIKYVDSQTRLLNDIHGILFDDFEACYNKYLKRHPNELLNNTMPEFFTSFRDRFHDTWIQFSKDMFIVPSGELEASTHLKKLERLVCIFKNSEEDLSEFEYYNDTIQTLLALQMESVLCLQQYQEALEN